MTVASSLNRADFTLASGTVSYPYSFRIFRDADLVVTRLNPDTGEETTLVLGTDYTVTGAGNYNGGNVVVDSSYASDFDGHELTARRVLAVVQETSIRNAGAFYPEVHEDAFDRQIMIAQQQQEELDRSVKVAETDSQIAPLPTATARASKYLAFDAAGDPVASAGTGADAGLRADLAASSGSSLMGFLHGGANAVALTLQAFLRGLYVTPEQYGAVGDGAADDTLAITRALAAGQMLRCKPGATYRITSRITVPSGKFIVGDRSTTFSMDTAAGFFDSTLLADYDEADGVGFYFTGATGGGIIGVRIRLSNRTAELIAGAVLVRSSSKVQINGCEFDNFSKAKVLRFESCTLSEAKDNYFHDCQISSATTGQLTCIDVDDNRPAGGSTGLIITGNRFKSITASAGFIASFLYQTDAINISHEDSGGHTITNNHIDTVGEGIDCFGYNCNISGNTVLEAYNVGIKLIHGARRNVVTGNQIRRPGLGGIVIAGVAADANHSENNIVTGNLISEVNAAGNWTASNTYGIKCENDGGGTKLARKNLIKGNQIVDGAAMKYGLLNADASAGNIYLDNMVDSFTLAEFDATGGSTYSFKSTKNADVQAYQGAAQSVGTGAFEILQLGTEAVDSQAEYNAGTYTYTASCPRALIVHATARTGGASSGKLWELEIRKNGTVVARSQVVAAGTDLHVAVSDVVDVVKADTITVYIKHNEAGAVNLTASTEATRLRIVEAR